MPVSRRILLLLLFLLFLDLSAENAFPQEFAANGYQYLSPLPSSLCHNPETILIIRYGEKTDISTLRNELVEITGSISGKHPGIFTLSHDQLTLTFTPDQAFAYNEKVFVHLCQGIKTKSGKLLPSFDSWFTIKPGTGIITGLPEDVNGQDSSPYKSGYTKAVQSPSLSFIDFNFPEITLSDQPGKGNILTTLIQNSTNYLYVFNNNAIPVFARMMPHPVSNLIPHKSGIITYYDSFVKGYVAIDSVLNAVDTFSMKNGYKTDSHELLLLSNGHSFMISYDPQIVDMSKVVAGGNPAATVTGLVIQELNENKDLLFQWRSWDYFNITDTYSNLLTSVIDYVHGNSLDADTDTTLIISSRNLNEITKINRLTGHIIWRLGGKNNEFVFENDPRRFAGQHTVLKHKNGTLTLFDNGVDLDPLYSRCIEYELDEINKKVKLIHEYRHTPDVYANVSGNMQQLDNRNAFIFWGPALDHSEQFINEYDHAGNAIFEARFGNTIYPTYRAYRSLWEPKSFTSSADTIQVKGMVQNTTLYRTFDIRNNTGKRITITSAHHRNRGFYATGLPVTIEAMSQAMFTIAFPSFAVGTVSDNIIFCQETDSAIVTRSLFVSINNTPLTGTENHSQTGFNLSPNPGKGEFNVEVVTKGRFSLKLTDLSGKTIWDKKEEGNQTYHIDLKSKPEGIYLLRLTEADTGIIHTEKIINQK